MKRWLLASVATMMVAGTAAGQADSSGVRVRFALEDVIKVGRPAPVFTLPYATRSGPGPADQPFDLAKELGRVVVIAFYPGDFTPGCTAEWRAFAQQADSLFGDGVVVAGISVDSLDSHVRFARELELPFKLLSDRSQQVARIYGVAQGAKVRRVVIVVGRDGRVTWFDPAFAELDPQRYVQLAAAVRAAKEK
jgi:peroxiredoxin Q/BCP